MPHDHPRHHHPHDHRYDHGHDHAHGPGHNHAHGDHLHSHFLPEDRAADMQVLAMQFIDGFVAAKAKATYLKLAGIALELDRGDGPSLKLVDVPLATEWQVGTASPSFGSQELSYLPLPGEMVTERTNMGLIYVSLREKRVVDLRDVLKERMDE